MSQLYSRHEGSLTLSPWGFNVPKDGVTSVHRLTAGMTSWQLRLQTDTTALLLVKQAWGSLERDDSLLLKGPPRLREVFTGASTAELSVDGFVDEDECPFTFSNLYDDGALSARNHSPVDFQLTFVEGMRLFPPRFTGSGRITSWQASSAIRSMVTFSLRLAGVELLHSPRDGDW